MHRKKQQPGVIPPPPQDPDSPCTVVNRLRLCLEPTAPCSENIRSSHSVAQWIREQQICDAVQEQIWCLCLDMSGRIRGFAMLVQGQVNEAAIAPADLLRVVVTFNAPSFILVHNHPSGNPGPSEHDRTLTKRIMEVAKIAGFNFLDHIIIAAGGEQYFSFRDGGLL